MSDYSIRQTEKDRDYRGSYDAPEARQWAESLTPEQTALCRGSGPAKAHDRHHGVHLPGG